MDAITALGLIAGSLTTLRLRRRSSGPGGRGRPPTSPLRRSSSSLPASCSGSPTAWWEGILPSSRRTPSPRSSSAW